MNYLRLNRKLLSAWLVLTFAIVALLAMLPTTPAHASTPVTIADVTGVTRAGLVGWLESNRFNSYYLTTPYVGSDWRSPNGDPSYNGSVGMNCTGFVWHAFTVAGASGMPGMTGWLSWINAHNIEHYAFYSKVEMLSSGVLEKGDIIWIWDGDPYMLNPYHHVGIFWGSSSSEDLFWHSSDNFNGNYITQIVGKASATSFTVIKTENRGYIDLQKVSTLPAVTQGNGDFSLAGATFGIFRDAACSVSAGTTIVTNASGYGISAPLPSGTYYVKETGAPMGYDLNSTVYTVTVFSGQTSRVNGAGGQVPNAPSKGRIDLVKKSHNPSLSEGNESYSLAGAIYSVYADAALTQRVAALTTDAGGTAISGELNAGTYYVKETQSAPGYALDPSTYQVAVRPRQTVRVNASTGYVTDRPQHNPLDIVVSKVDSETNRTEAQGAASLAGAHFEIKHYGGYQSLTDSSWIGTKTPLRSWVIYTDEAGYARLHPDYVLSGDAIDIDSEGRYTLPLGTVTIKEIKAPAGYLLGDQTVHIQHIRGGGAAETVDSFVAPIVPNQIRRGDLELIKAGEGTYERMGGVPFSITSKTTGESHVIVTDANGYASTASHWNPHAQHTNRGLTDEDGVWFGEPSALKESVGALPFDTYTIEELMCEANQGRTLIPPFDIVISRDGHLVSLGTLLNKPPVVPSIGTTALDGHTKTKLVSADAEALIIDTVTYTDIAAQATYRLTGVLMDKETGERLLVGGEEVWAEREFTPAGSGPYVSGTIDMHFSFDGTGLGNKDLVVFEYLYRGETLIASHEDIDDVDQTVTMVTPHIATTARDGHTKESELSADAEAIIIDTVTYANLIPAKMYTLTGVLMDKATGLPLLIDGEKVTVTKEFAPESTHGSVDVHFEFNALSLGGKDVVVFEYLYKDGREVATHTDINDSGQTVSFRTPDLKSKALVHETGKGVAVAGGVIRIVDTVMYTDIIPGKTYVLKGIVMDRATGEPLIVGGQEVVAHTEFASDSSSGTVDVVFELDTTGLGDRQIVVFERLYRDGHEVATHTDLDDEEQTITLSAPPQAVAPSTGDTMRWGYGVLIAVVGIALAVCSGVLGGLRKGSARR